MPRVGFAGNSHGTPRIERRLEGPDRVVRTVVIRGYRGPPLDGAIARPLVE